MFADLSGFTAISEKLDPEEVTGFVNACFEKLESVILVHGGIVDKYLGDCIKAVFGFTPAIEDPTLHAVKAAVEIRAALAQFNRDNSLPSPLDVHIGINTGMVIPVVMSGAATHGFSVMGDAVRLAARLEDTSDKGQIYVGPETYEQTKGEFEYRALPPLVMEANREPVPVYELVAAAPQRRITRASERRQATVVFADVIGVEDASEHLEPEAFARFTQECFDMLGAAVTEHGGVVDKYMGDGMMALFGVPNAIENAPRQALNAAIEIRQRLARFVAERGLQDRLDIHIGINTGLVIAGDIGGRAKRDFTVMGDTVNLAARLKEAATPGAIYVGPETHRHTRGDFEYRALEPLRLKGKELPVATFELTSVAKQMHRTPVARDRMVFSAMVGRDAELALFRRAIERLATGAGGIVSIVGEAGLGKSRLLSEALVLAEGMSLPVLVGRSLIVGRSQSFHPFVDLLRHWAGLGDDGGEEQSLTALETAVRDVLPEQADEVFPFVTRLLGLRATGAHAERLAGIEGEALEKLILKSTRELFRAIAQRRPTLLVFEDLHWADQSSLNLLESLLALGGETPLLFVHVFRPLFEETADRVLRLCQERFADRHSEIRLDKLGEAQSARLIRNLLNIDDLPARVRTLIAAKAEGNPFYIEEVVRSLIDEGAIEYSEGRFHVTEKINSVVIPGTIQDVIMARVDRLDESARQLLQMASVVGRHFYHRIISHIIERDTPLEADLAILKEKQLIQESERRWEVAVGERSVAEELEYIFKHALAQEAVYQSVLLKTRKEMHGRVAEAIESLFADRLTEFYATLAYHYSRAERLEPAEHYLCRAGEAALSSAAFSEALQQFREAAAIYDKLHGATGGDRAHRASLEKHLGLALLNAGHNLESIDHFDRALELLGERVPRHELAAAWRWAVDMVAVLFRIYLYEGRRGPVPDIDRHREIFKLYFERGHAEVTSNPRRLFFQTATPVRRYHRMAPELIEGACGMYVSMATIFAFSGISFAISKRLASVAAGLLRDDNIQDVFRYRAMLFTYEYLRGKWSGAPALAGDLIEDALRHGMLWDVTTYLCIEMDRRLRRGEFDRARDLLRKFAEIRDTYGYAYAENNREGMSLILGLHERKLDGIVPLARHHADAAVSPEASIRVMTFGEMARAQILLGDRAGAVESLRRAEELTGQEGVVSPWHQSSAHVAQLLFDLTALEAAADGDRSRWGTLKRAGTRSARRALRTANKVAKERIETYRLAARLWWVLGKRSRAVAWWGRAIAEAQRMGARPELARTHGDIGQRIGTARLNGANGPAHLHVARQLFSELGLEWDRRQIDPAEPLRHDAEPDSAVA